MASPAKTDHLLNLARKGDRAAFSKLAGLWYKRIYNFTFKYVLDRDTAMDITQIVFITAYEKLNHLKSNGKLKPWLYRIAVNLCHEEDRKKKRNSLYDLDHLIQDEPKESYLLQGEDPQQKLIQKELQAQLLKALSMIPAEQREVVIMKVYEGMKFREIASILSISENTAKSRMYYGLNGLKKILDQWNITVKTIFYES